MIFTSPVRRLLFANAGFVALVCGGAAGYWWLGAGRWTFYEGVYMTIITVFTVGYGELPEMSHVHHARTLTMVLIVFGVVALAYVHGNITALLVQNVIGQAFRKNRMKKQIAALRNHIVVAGCGSTGKHVVEELVASKTPFVVIDRSLQTVERVSADIAHGKMLFVVGDATDDHALVEAGVERAKGVVAALTHDKDNLFVTLSARSLNAKARITAKVTETETAPKMMKAGATTVVSPAMIGGHRMASDVIRPEVNEFLDLMLRDKNRNLSLEEVTIPEGSLFVGMSLKETPIRRETRLLVVAVRDSSRTIVYNPEPEYILLAGCTLIVMGETDGVVKLRNLVRDGMRPTIV